MPKVPVLLRYCPGVERDTLTGVTITGGWDAAGLPSATWSSIEAERTVDEYGLTAYAARVELDAGALGEELRWGTWVRHGDGSQSWGIAAEVPDLGSKEQHRTFVLGPPGGAPQVETYRVSWHRARGAQLTADGGIEFSAWAPDARAVEVVFGGPSGYVADDGYGADPSLPALPLQREPDGVWRRRAPGFPAHAGRPYAYRVTRDDGSVNVATDMFSRRQAGEGDLDPGGAHYDGSPSALDGRPSCSVVVDTRVVAGLPEAAYWTDDLDPARPVPHRIEDLVIYELHVGALDPSVRTAGTFEDAIELLPYLDDLGVNAVELLPMFQFDGTLSWGYGSSQMLAIDAAAGGRDGLAAFVKACHRRGIAVLMDVVYNHWTNKAARAAWQYDSTAPSRNVYYWYEGTESQYADPSGGYLDNDSSGWAPRYRDEHVRALFVSSAVMLADELHIDGVRVDQTAAIHAYNRRHADGAPDGVANAFGRKLLRELCQTLKTLRPDQVLIAEDHSGWAEVTEPAETGGVGFDATWYVDFYHHLVGENGRGPEWAKLLLTAARDQTGPLAMGMFAAALAASGGRRVVYESSHDEAGNDQGTERTILVAVDGAPLIGETRRYAEARCRFACGMAMLSAGTPMFLMGEEVGAQKAYTYDKFYGRRRTCSACGRRAGLRCSASIRT